MSTVAQCLYLPKTSGQVNCTESCVPVSQMEKLLKAYSAKDLETVKHLLTTDLGVNYQDPIFANRTPILYAVKCDFVEAVDELLKGGADITLADDTGITPLHAAVRNGNLNILKRLLEVGADPNVKNKHNQTSLHVATRALGGDDEENAFIIVETLLNAGAILSSKDEDNRTPLHEAAFVGNDGVISLFLERREATLLYERDIGGRTPLHLAVLGARSLLTVRLLLKHNSPMDARDIDGRTPLHYVAGRSINYTNKDFDVDCLELLLTSGASVEIQDKNSMNALSFALQRTMWWNRQSLRDSIFQTIQLLVDKGSSIVDEFDMWRIVETFPSLVMVALNQSIRVNTSVKDSLHLMLIFDFRPLAVNTKLLDRQYQETFGTRIPVQPIPPCLLNYKEISMMNYIYNSGHKNILRHPLCSAFLHLKWLKVRKYFITHVLLYLLFVLTFTAYILNMQHKYIIKAEELNNNFSSNFDLSNETSSDHIFNSNTKISPLWVILMCFIIFFTVKEMLQIAQSPSIYIRHFENFVDILILLCVLLLLYLPHNFSIWQRYISTVAVIASWSRLLLFLGQFPSCGVYIVMFSTVCKTVIRFLGIYVPLLIAFVLGFLILLHELSSFDGIFTSVSSTLVMMVGEIEYEDRFLNNHYLPTEYFPCIILIFFLLFIHIIMSNLLIAIAVNDLNSIQQRSEILRLSRQIELLVTVECFLQSSFVPNCISKYLHKKFSIFEEHYTGLIVLSPNKKHGFCEKLFLNLLFIVRCRRFLTNIFEYFVVNFIPPDVEPSMPKSLIQEATQLVLKEREIKERDKLLLSKSHQVYPFRRRASLKKQRNITKDHTGSLLYSLPQRDGFQKKFKELPDSDDDMEMVNLITHFRQQEEIMKSTPSMRASLRRSGISKETFHDLHKNELSDERQVLNKEIKELRKTVSDLQNLINMLTQKLPNAKENDLK